MLITGGLYPGGLTYSLANGWAYMGREGGLKTRGGNLKWDFTVYRSLISPYLSYDNSAWGQLQLNHILKISCYCKKELFV